MSVCNNVLSVLLTTAEHSPQKRLLATTGGCSIAYGQFLSVAFYISEKLKQSGLHKGELVVIQAEDPTVLYCSIFGAWIAGGVAVPLNMKIPPASLQEIVDKVTPACALVEGEAKVCFGAAVVVSVSTDLLQRKATTYVGNLECHLPDPESTALVLFTSGTTGISKGVQLSWLAINFNAFSTSFVLGLMPSDRIYINTPPYFTSSICHFLTLLSAGGSTVYSAGFHFGDDLFKEMATMECTGFGGAPAHIVRVVLPYVKTPELLPDLPLLRFWVSSGDYLAPAVLDEAKKMLPHVAFYVVYGLTEVAGRLCILPPAAQAERIGSVGKPLDGMSVTVCDDNDLPLPAGHSGQICTHGPGLMSGYYNAPQINAISLGPFGFRSGDIGHIDADGYLWIEGRKDDIFKSGGEKVSLQALQQALLKIDGILDAAVIPEADEILGQVPLAFVVLTAETPPSRMEILKALRRALTPANLPKRIIIVEAIPRTGSGKAIRSELVRLGGL